MRRRGVAFRKHRTCSDPRLLEEVGDLNSGEIYANPDDALCGLIKWLAVSLMEHDNFMCNVIKRVGSKEAK